MYNKSLIFNKQKERVELRPFAWLDSSPTPDFWGGKDKRRYLQKRNARALYRNHAHGLVHLEVQD